LEELGAEYLEDGNLTLVRHPIIPLLAGKYWIGITHSCIGWAI